MKIRVVEFRYIRSNPALWLFLFAFNSMLFMLALMYCLQKGVFALIVVFPLVLYGLTALLYEKIRRNSPSLLIDVDSIKWKTGKKKRHRIRFGTVESICIKDAENDFRLVIQENDGQMREIAIPGLGQHKDELSGILKKKAGEFEFALDG
ncbi:MAG: hypothetical protein JEZ02_00780 [Desulfatibacillum sp.]|nr:hypothetical protein [Desulfatibacillum sp.]